MRSMSIRAIRRSELSRAAFEAVAQYGLRGTTLERVGEIAGVSKGVVLHHFKDKSSLLESVFRRSNSLLSESVVELYRHADTPYERLWAIIVANFSEPIYNRKVCQAWMSLMSEVPHSKQCQRIQKACNARIRSNLAHELKHFLGKEDAKNTARHLGILIDGIWIRSGSAVEPVDSEEAISDMEYAIMKFLPHDAKSVEKQRKARQKIETVAGIALGSRVFQKQSLQA